MKSILIPTDFSDQAAYALDLGRQLAAKRQLTIRLLHVVEQPSSPYLTAVSGGLHHQMDNVYVLRLIEKIKSQLQLLITELQIEGITASYQIKIGGPFRRITDQIKSEDHDLIIMGTGGTSGVNEVLAGSNTEKVVRQASVPVITLKEKTNLEDIEELVFAINSFHQSRYLADELKKIQQLFPARVHLVTVNTPGNFFSDREVKKCLGEFAANNELKNYTVNIYSDETEEDGICHFAEDLEADMIIMATHGRTGINHLLSGSLSERMVNHASIPVLTIPLKAGKRKKDLDLDLVI